MTTISGFSKLVAAFMYEEAVRYAEFVDHNGTFVASEDIRTLHVPWYTLTVEINPKFCDEKTAWLENPCHKLKKLVLEELKIENLGHIVVSRLNAVKFFFPDEDSLSNARNILSHGKMDDYLLTAGHSMYDFYFHVLKKSKKKRKRRVERDPARFYSLSNFAQSTFAPLLGMDRDEQLAWKESLGQLFLESFAIEFCSALNESTSISPKRPKNTSDNLHIFWNKRGSNLQREKNRFFYNIFRSCKLLEMRSVEDYGPVDFVLKHGMNVETLAMEPGLLVRRFYLSDINLIVPIKHVPLADERIIEMGRRLAPYVSRTFDSGSKVIYNVNLHLDYSGRINVDIEEYYWNDDGPNFEETKANLLELLADETNYFGLNWIQLRTTSASGNRKRKSFKLPSKTNKRSSNLIWSANATNLPVNNPLSEAMIELGNFDKKSALVTLRFMQPTKKLRDVAYQNYFTYECLLELSRHCGKVVMSRRLYDYHAVAKPKNFVPLQRHLDTLRNNMDQMIKFITKRLKDDEVIIFFNSDELISSFAKLLSCPSVKRVLYLITDSRLLEKYFHPFGNISQVNFFVPTKVIPLNLRYDSVELNYLVLFERRSFSDVREVGDILSEDCEWLNSFKKHEDNIRSGVHRRPKDARGQKSVGDESLSSNGEESEEEKGEQESEKNPSNVMWERKRAHYFQNLESSLRKKQKKNNRMNKMRKFGGQNKGPGPRRGVGNNSGRYGYNGTRS